MNAPWFEYIPKYPWIWSSPSSKKSHLFELCPQFFIFVPRPISWFVNGFLNYGMTVSCVAINRVCVYCLFYIMLAIEILITVPIVVNVFGSNMPLECLTRNRMQALSIHPSNHPLILFWIQANWLPIWMNDCRWLMMSNRVKYTFEPCCVTTESAKTGILEWWFIDLNDDAFDDV